MEKWIVFAITPAVFASITSAIAKVGLNHRIA
jgi:uncharacterized membrane protein